MEISKFDMAACKRTAQNVKMLRRKLEKVNEKLEGIMKEKEALEDEIKTWEYPIIKKFRYTSEVIIANGGIPDAVQEPAIPESSMEMSEASDSPIADNE